MNSKELFGIPLIYGNYGVFIYEVYSIFHQKLSGCHLAVIIIT